MPNSQTTGPSQIIPYLIVGAYALTAAALVFKAALALSPKSNKKTPSESQHTTENSVPPSELIKNPCYRALEKNSANSLIKHSL